MDQSQQHDMDGNRYTGFVTPSYYQTESPGHEPMVTSSAHIHNGSHTGGCFSGGDVSDSQSGLPFNQNHNPYLTTSAEEFDNDYPPSGNILSQGTSSGYESAVLTLQQKPQPSSPGRGMSDPIQAEGAPILPHQQPHLYSVLCNCWSATWRPMKSPGHMSASFNGTSNAPSQALSSGFPDCLHYPHVDGESIYPPDQMDASQAMEWKFPEANGYFHEPAEANFPSGASNQQIATQDPRFSTSDNKRFDALSSEQFSSGNSLRIPTTVTAFDVPVTIGASKRLPKKRKRKPRPLKPRKLRTLSVEGKAHAKAVRELGACGYCRKKKTKARHPWIRNLVSTRL